MNQDHRKQYQVNRFLYQFIGKQWGWIDKLFWSSEEWFDYVQRDQLKTFVAYFRGTIAGYYELDQQQGGEVEIVYFGVSPNFIGIGFGGHLLSHAIKSAWSCVDTKRVWLQTCTSDHPSALQNYKARGFTLYQETISE